MYLLIKYLFPHIIKTFIDVIIVVILAAAYSIFWRIIENMAVIYWNLPPLSLFVNLIFIIINLSI